MKFGDKMSKAGVVLHNLQELRLILSVFYLVFLSSLTSGFYFLVQTIQIQTRKVSMPSL